MKSLILFLLIAQLVGLAYGIHVTYDGDIGVGLLLVCISSAGIPTNLDNLINH